MVHVLSLPSSPAAPFILMLWWMVLCVVVSVVVNVYDGYCHGLSRGPAGSFQTNKHKHENHAGAQKSAESNKSHDSETMGSDKNDVLLLLLLLKARTHCTIIHTTILIWYVWHSCTVDATSGKCNLNAIAMIYSYQNYLQQISS